MSEVFFILTVIYVAYVIFVVIGNEKVGSEPQKAAKPSSVAFKQPTVAQKELTTDSVAEQAQAKPSPIVKPVEVKKAAIAEVIQPKSNKLAAPKIELRTVLMKNPKTGEQVKVATNYRMVKRWVKEALVTEDLLEKIYKNNELDNAAKIKVAKALSIIKAMDKYKP